MGERRKDGLRLTRTFRRIERSRTSPSLCSCEKTNTVESAEGWNEKDFSTYLSVSEPCFAFADDTNEAGQILLSTRLLFLSLSLSVSSSRTDLVHLVDLKSEERIGDETQMLDGRDKAVEGTPKKRKKLLSEKKHVGLGRGRGLRRGGKKRTRRRGGSLWLRRGR